MFHIKSKLIVMFFSLLCMILSGCVQGDLHVTIHKDGSGIYQWKILTTATAKRYVQYIVPIYSKKGYEAKMIQEKGKVGFVATKPVKNIAKEPLNKEIETAIPAEWMDKNKPKTVLSTTTQKRIPNVKALKELTIHPHFWKTSLLFQTNVNMQKNINNLAGPYAPYISNFLDRIKFRFILSLPIAPLKQNASIVSNNGKTLVWNLKLGQSNPIFIGTDVPTPIVLLLAAIYGQTSYVPQFWEFLWGWIFLMIVIIAAILYTLKFIFGRFNRS
ncbi:hypothetical protein [Shimazuella kribbensis]|uniref:hypothetical protein n=1 Tax=Shimazuella kribbensis TaxID=139808 RepID=UPI00040D2625|nr:hypothetical protein [Shimazuella kribbensis]